jgi:DNA-binding PadR family transcriptional regulator
MSLDHVLLGALREPASGYELKARFDEVFRHFWPAELSQIYRTLKRLEDDGLLTSRRAASDIGPERRVYRTTARGRTALRKWLQGGPQVGDDRHAFCAQVFFLDELESPDERLAFLRSLRDAFAERRAGLEAIETTWKAEDPRYPDALPPAEMAQQFTLALGIEKFGAIARWAESCIARLEAAMQKEGPAAGPGVPEAAGPDRQNQEAADDVVGL